MLLMASSPKPTQKIFQKVLILLFFGVAVASFVYTLYLDNYYYLNGARDPVPAEGRIYRQIVHHGWQVFLTRREQFNFEVVLPSIGLGSFLIAGLLDLRWKHFAKQNQNAKPIWSFIRGRRNLR